MSNLAMTMRTKPEVNTLSIDDLYNNLRVFEQEIQGASKTSSSAQNVAFVSQSKSSTNKVKYGFTGAYSTCTPSTSSTNIPEKEVLAGFADEVIYSLFAKQSEDWDLLHEDLEQIDDLDIEEMDINWQIAMIAIRMKKFYKKTRRRVRVDGKTPVGFDKKKLECFNCHNTCHFARKDKSCTYGYQLKCLSFTDSILPLVEPLSARNLTGEASSSADVAIAVITALSTTFVQTNPVIEMLSTLVPQSPKVVFEKEELDTTPKHVPAP
ncbi:hypothetical protein Tco_0484887 [Tanacetum coccineum]